jgi:hypothetical protein
VKCKSPALVAKLNQLILINWTKKRRKMYLQLIGHGMVTIPVTQFQAKDRMFHLFSSAIISNTTTRIVDHKLQI